jgi:hypothetical protein
VNVRGSRRMSGHWGGGKKCQSDPVGCIAPATVSSLSGVPSMSLDYRNRY